MQQRAVQQYESGDEQAQRQAEHRGVMELVNHRYFRVEEFGWNQRKGPMANCLDQQSKDKGDCCRGVVHLKKGQYCIEQAERQEEIAAPGRERACSRCDTE